MTYQLQSLDLVRKFNQVSIALFLDTVNLCTTDWWLFIKQNTQSSSQHCSKARDDSEIICTAMQLSSSSLIITMQMMKHDMTWNYLMCAQNNWWSVSLVYCTRLKLKKLMEKQTHIKNWQAQDIQLLVTYIAKCDVLENQQPFSQTFFMLTRVPRVSDETHGDWL